MLDRVLFTVYFAVVYLQTCAADAKNDSTDLLPAPGGILVIPALMALAVVAALVAIVWIKRGAIRTAISGIFSFGGRYNRMNDDRLIPTNEDESDREYTTLHYGSTD